MANSVPTSSPFVRGQMQQVAAAPEPRLLVDLEGIVLAVSPSLAHALSTRAEAIVGATLYESLPSGETSDLPLLVTGLLTNGRDRVDTHATAVDPDGHPVDLTLTFELVRDPSGDPALLRVAVDDSRPREDAAVLDARPAAAPDRTATDGAEPVPPGLPTRGRVPDEEPVPPHRSTPPESPAPVDPVAPLGGDAAPGWLAALVTGHRRPAAGAARLDALAVLNDPARSRLLNGDTAPTTLAAVLTRWGAADDTEELDARLGRDEATELDLRRTGPDGTVETLDAELFRIPDGERDWIVLVVDDPADTSDIALTHHATHDPLTGLPNRLMLLDRLQRTLDSAERDGTLVAVAFFDLDRFKQVNDTLGHEAGDELLRLVAHRISSVVRPTDVVARLGGDEFIIVCEAVDDEDHALEIVNRVSSAIDARPFMIDDTEVPITSSGGISLSFPGAHPEGLLRDADAAMYRSKHQGRARLEVFDDEMRSETSERLQRAEELAEALDDDRIGVVFQPVVGLADGRLFSVEALARWHRADDSVLHPDEFIELAEASGLVVRLGLKVLHRACLAAASWSTTPEPPPVQVNISARQLAHAGFPVLVRGLLEAVELPAERLCLEITESALLEDTQASMGTLDALREIGVRLAIDDFGTGYSSLSYLSRLPVDQLKIDASFVRGLAHSADHRAIVSAVINLAHSLGMHAVAEGVETEREAQILADLGCDAAQGYLYAAPEIAADVAARINSRRGASPAGDG